MLREGKSTAGDFRIPSGCAVSSVFSRSGKRLDGSDIIRSIEIMHDRSNGLGGGFGKFRDRTYVLIHLGFKGGDLGFQSVHPVLEVTIAGAERRRGKQCQKYLFHNYTELY